MRLTLIISSLSFGGAERVMSTLANAWVEKGYEVTIITIAALNKDQYQLDPRVRQVGLDMARSSRGVVDGILANIKRMQRLRRALLTTKPDYVISFLDRTNVLTLFSTRGTGIPVIVSERVDPYQHTIGGGVWELLRRWSYPWAAKVVMQTHDLTRRLRQSIGNAKFVTIPNPLPEELVQRAPGRRVPSGERRRIVAMGRLDRQKGFDMLITAFAPLATCFTEWDLWIWGEGEERPALNALMKSLGLAGRVILPGKTEAPWDELQKADLFVLSSRFEGMPNVMMEAMALGVSVVAFDCPCGPREISLDGHAAVLVQREDVSALSRAIEQLMADPGERVRLGQAALSVRERFTLDGVLTLWDELFGTFRNR